ncbi:uncharacterized protein LOC121593353 [Anopheles merus]|uniref:uncharacterized protein LOC121593353 n=1 Tax=Anopheles merus TaxID=30066 RepID=UPI001BE41943|nr:uncharacterized protein LOC121593353 [Anopheles merus]
MPNSKCAAAFCNNRRVDVRKRKLALIFHAFPADEALRSRWMAFCRRGVDWTPFKTDAVCSAHFRHEDYQMAHSPLLKLSKNLRRLRVDAVPSVREGMVVTISKKQKLEELVRQQRLEELYRQNNPSAEPSTDFDHTYSGVTVAEELKNESPVLEKIVYRLQKFPNLCALCLRAIDDEKLFTPFASYSEALESTIEQKFDEITGEVIDSKERTGIHHLLPDKVCAECLEVLIQFHHYQRQLQCLKRFSTGMAQLLKGNRQPLAELYAAQGDYLANVLKNLNICQAAEENITLQRLEAEVATYGRVKKYTTFEQDLPRRDTGAVMNRCEETIPASCFQIDCIATSPREAEQRHRSQSTQEADGTGRAKKWICPYEEICREWFLDQASLQKHIHDDHKVFKCRTCGYRIKFYDLFKKHIESHDIARALLLSHNKKDTPTGGKCETCGKQFQSDEQLRRHRETHADSGNYVCGRCLGVYASEHKYNNHRCSRRVHEATGLGQFEAMDAVTKYDCESDMEEELLSQQSDETGQFAPSRHDRSVEMLSIEILQ